MQKLAKLFNFYNLSTDFLNDKIKIGEIEYCKYNNFEGIVKNELNVQKDMFVFILSGEALIHFKNQKIDLKSGDAYLLKRGYYVMCEIVQNKPYKSFNFFLDENILKEFILQNHIFNNEQIQIEYNDELFKFSANEALVYSVKSFALLFENQAIHPNFIKIKFFELLFNILNIDTHKEFLKYLKFKLPSNEKRLIEFMESSYTNFKRVEDFAKEYRVSLSTFKSEFKRVFNTSPKEWINKKRIEKAMVLLKSTNKSITEICFEVGIDNSSYFSYLFKKNFGITPSEFRES